MMTREEVLADMQAGYDDMTSEDKEKTIVTLDGKDWNPTMILAEIRSGSEAGQRFEQDWAKTVEDDHSMIELLLVLLQGGRSLPPCDDPEYEDCNSSDDSEEPPPPSQLH